MSHASDHLLDYPAEDRHADPLDPVPDGPEMEMETRRYHRAGLIITDTTAPGSFIIPPHGMERHDTKLSPEIPCSPSSWCIYPRCKKRFARHRFIMPAMCPMLT